MAQNKETKAVSGDTASGKKTTMTVAKGTDNQENTRLQRDGKKSLNPQAAQYYKRLLLVSDRYIYLLKRHKRLRVTLWFVILGWITTILIAIRPLTEAVMLLIKEHAGSLGL